MGQIVGTFCMYTCIEPAGGAVCADEPYQSHQLSAETLTEILQDKDVIPDSACVQEIKTTKFGVGEGLLSVMYRLELDYGSNPDPKWPASLVAKMTPASIKPRVLGEVLDLFKVEVKWYSEGMPQRCGLPAPIVYHAAHGGYGRYVVIMEDLAPARPIDQLTGAKPNEVIEAVKFLSKLHACYRGRVHESVETKDFIRPVTDVAYANLVRDAFHKGVKSLTEERYAVFGLEVGQISALCEALEYLDETFEEHVIPDMLHNHQSANTHAQFVTTVTHGDFRGENVFPDAGAGGGMKVIDYQCVREGNGCDDLNYFIFGSMSIEARRQQEMQLLGLYFEEMQKNGSVGFTVEELLLSYQRGLLLGLSVFVIAANDCDVDSDRAKETIRMWGIRLQAMVTDWQFLQSLKLRDSKRGDDGVTSKYSPSEIEESLPPFAHVMLRG